MLDNKHLMDGVSRFLVETFQQVEKNFVAQKYVHYIFTPRGVTKILEGLGQFRITSEEDLGTALMIKSNQIYRNKLATPTDRATFDKIINTVSQKELSIPLRNYSSPDWVTTKLTLNLMPDAKKPGQSSKEDPLLRQGTHKSNQSNPDGPAEETHQDLLTTGKISLQKKEDLMRVIQEG
jgi:hypothetical protein